MGVISIGTINGYNQEYTEFAGSVCMCVCMCVCVCVCTPSDNFTSAPLSRSMAVTAR